MNFLYEANQEWRQLARQLVTPQQLVLVIGASDVGKSTFCRFLVKSAVEKGLKVAFIDTDIGQSQIGPPTTIGMRVFTSNRIDGEAEDTLYFVGAISPQRNQLEMITGARLMVEKAHETGCDFIVIDTTGYVHDTAAVVLKQHKIELLRPCHLICLGRVSELERITASYSQLDWLSIHHLLPHKQIRYKSVEARRRYRSAQFSAYFAGSTVQQIPFEQIRGARAPFFIGRIANEKELALLTRFAETGVHHAEWGHRALSLVTEEPLSQFALERIKNYLSLKHVTAEVRSYFEKRLVGLIGTTGNTLAIGIIETIDFQNRQLSIRCQADVAKDACILQFGDYEASRRELIRLEESEVSK